MGRSATLAAMGMAAAGVAVTALGDAALLDVAVSGALLAGAAAFMPGSASSKALKAKGAPLPDQGRAPQQLLHARGLLHMHFVYNDASSAVPTSAVFEQHPGVSRVCASKSLQERPVSTSVPYALGSAGAPSWLQVDPVSHAGPRTRKALLPLPQASICVLRPEPECARRAGLGLETLPRLCWPLTLLLPMIPPLMWLPLSAGAAGPAIAALAAGMDIMESFNNVGKAKATDAAAAEEEAGPVPAEEETSEQAEGAKETQVRGCG